MLHYVKWIMGTKPFLVLELDSHSADAGVDTRVEAFLDIIEGYRSKIDRDPGRSATTTACASSTTARTAPPVDNSNNRQRSRSSATSA